MKRFRKITALILTIVLCLSTLLPAYAAEVKSTEKARVLNLLSILKGDGKDYNLSGQLKRSEAAAFIVRLMGKDFYVMSNQDKYKTTKFADVPSNAWYAPYVGFCTEKSIFGGYPDGKFYPNENISEKSFLKIVMGALGYIEGQDFTWNNLYQVAYNIGLVTEDKYKTASEDNKNYTREAVVTVLYNSLTKTTKNSNVTVVNNLITTGAIGLESAKAAGFIKDETPTEIKQVTPVNDTRVMVTLNEKVKELKNTNFNIYEADNKTNKLSVSAVSQNDTQIILTTSKQTADKNYTVEIQNIEDLGGVKLPMISKNFTGFKYQEVKSEFFIISKIVPVSKSKIDIYFTQPVNMNTEFVRNYELLQDGTSFVKGDFNTLSAKCVGDNPNVISLYLKDKTMSEGAEYTLKLSGELLSAYGNKLCEGQGQSVKFIANGSNNEDFYVLDVVPLDNKTVLVEYNRDADSLDIQNAANYVIPTSPVLRVVPFSDGELKGKAVRLALANTLRENTVYELTIKNIKDIHKVDSINESKHPFYGLTTAHTDLAVVNVTAQDKTTLAVYFDRPINAQNATMQGFYTIQGVSNGGYIGVIQKICYDPRVNPYMVKIYLAANTPVRSSDTYKITVNNAMQDELGFISSKSAQITFNGTDADKIKPLMYEAMVIGKDTIRVRLSEDIMTSGINAVTSNYTLEYKEGDTKKTLQPSGVSFYDSTTMILKFDSLDISKSYTIKFTQLMDASGLYSRIAADGLDSLGVVLGN